MKAWLAVTFLQRRTSKESSPQYKVFEVFSASRIAVTDVMNKPPIDRYRDAVGRLLMQFQWMESFLRAIVGCSYEILDQSAKPPVVFKPKSIRKKALGSLIALYKEISTNRALADKAEKLNSERNQVAHASFILTVEESNNEDFLEKEITRLGEIASQVSVCNHELKDELLLLSSSRGESSVDFVKRQARKPEKE